MEKAILPDSKLNNDFISFLKESFIFRFDNLLNQLNLLLETKLSADSVHDSRVASRRLDTLFYAFGYIFPYEYHEEFVLTYKKYFKPLGKIREADISIDIMLNYIKLIHIKPPEIDLLLNSIIIKSKNLRNDVNNDDIFSAKEKISVLYKNMIELIENLSKNNFQFSFDIIMKSVIHKLVSETQELIITDNNKIKAIHRLRIRFKYLRYFLEILNMKYNNSLKGIITDIRNFTDLCGDIHDYYELKKYIKSFMKNNLGEYEGIISIRGNHLKAFYNYIDAKIKKDTASVIETKKFSSDTDLYKKILDILKY